MTGNGIAWPPRDRRRPPRRSGQLSPTSKSGFFAVDESAEPRFADLQAVRDLGQGEGFGDRSPPLRITSAFVLTARINQIKDAPHPADLALGKPPLFT